MLYRRLPASPGSAGVGEAPDILTRGFDGQEIAGRIQHEPRGTDPGAAERPVVE